MPLLLVAVIALIWLWKPWQRDDPLAMGPSPGVSPDGLAMPTPSGVAATEVITYEVVPTATPLLSPTPLPTATLPPDQTRHTVESGETVSTIAKKYGATVSAILAANGLKSTSTIRPGDELVIPLPVANTSTPTPTLTPSPTPFVYTIKRGDTLSAIAKRFKTTVEALMAANGIVDATNLKVGTALNIVQPPDYAANMAYAEYEVQQGDTLYTLSSKFGVSVATIKQTNNLQGDRLRVGQRLRFPVGTATPAPTASQAPTPSPTPGPPRPAPILLGPPANSLFEGTQAAILLNWASVGFLDEDEWYVVRLRSSLRTANGADQPPLVWTKTTALRIPAEWYQEGLADPQRFRWRVIVARKTGVAPDGTWIGEPISPESETRAFFWK